MLIKEGRIELQSLVLCQILNILRDELGGILDPAGLCWACVSPTDPALECGLWLPPLGLGFWETELKM